MDTKVSFDFDLIAIITGFPKVGVEPTQFFIGKEKDKHLATKMKEKYSLVRDKRGFDIASIYEQVVRFATKELSIKILRKMRSNHYTTGVIVVAE